MTEKRYSYDNKTVSLLKDGEFWLDGQIDTGCNHSEICEELNTLHKEIQELKQRNQRQYEQLKELTELMYERQWGKLENMVEEWEKVEELLQKEWGTYCENK